MSRRQAGWISLIAILATLWPVKQNWADRPKDNFPLSYYPMFSTDRGSSYTMRYFVGEDEEGNEHILDYKLAGTGGFNQVRRQINKQSRDSELALALTQRVAERVAHSSRYKEVTDVHFIRGSFNMDSFFLEGSGPQKKRIIATCPVNR